MHPKDAEGIANSVDPDQEQSDRFCTVCPDLSVQKLRNITLLSFLEIIPIQNDRALMSKKKMTKDLFSVKALN